MTERHRLLRDDLRAEASTAWSDRALLSCLDCLATSTVTEAHEVQVVDAWADGPMSFCVLYRNPYSEAIIGLRRDAADAREALAGPWIPGRSMTTGYDMDDEAVSSGDLPAPTAFGRNVADFDIGEPHGPSDEFLLDEDGIAWRGNLDTGVPRRP